MINAPLEQLKVHLKSVLPNSIKHSFDPSVDTLPARNLEDLLYDVDGGIRIKDDVVCSCRFCEGGFSGRGRSSNDDSTEGFAPATTREERGIRE